MKRHVENKIVRRSRRGLKAALALAVLAAIGVGALFASRSLKTTCRERSAITNVAEQVKITSGKMVRPEVIAEHFGLRSGANLDLIDFPALRRELLKKVFTLKSVTVRRQMPDRVEIVAEERTPVARIQTGGRRGANGRVVDDEGVVFICARGTQMLPIIREAASSATEPGRTLSGRSALALELVTLSREAEFLELGVLEVDATNPDYLTMTLSNYSKAKIAWKDHADLALRLRRLLTVIRSRTVPDVKVWNATLPGKIFADTQEKP